MKLKLQSSIGSLLFLLFFLANLNNARAQFRDTTTYDFGIPSSGCLICGSGYDCFTTTNQTLVDNQSRGRLAQIKIIIKHTACGTGNFYAIMNGDTLGMISPAYVCACNSCATDTIVADFSKLSGYLYNNTNNLTFTGITLCMDQIQVVRLFVGTGPNDATVLSVDSPSHVCPGTRNIVVTVANAGINRIDSVKVHWTYNGVTQTTYRYNSILDTLGGSGTNKARIVLGSKTLVSGKRDTLKVWTSMPNGVADTANLNDTIRAFIKPSLGDTVTVGGTNPDYTSIQAAINDLQTNGICGPVVVDIRPGSYNEQLRIGTIAGTDSINTVTFRSSTGDSTDVSIYYSSFTSADNFTILLKNARHIIFTQLTLEGVGTTYGHVVEIQGTFLNLSFRSCLLSGYSGSTTSTNHALVFLNSITGSGNRKILFDRCEFEFGSSGFYSTISSPGLISDLAFTNNFFNNQYYTNVFAYYFNNVMIHGNLMQRPVSSTSGGYGIFLYNNRNITITGNRILQLNGASGGIYTESVNRTGSFRNLIANNFISVGRAASVSANAWYSYNCNFMDFYNNSTFSKSTSTGYNNLQIYYGSSIRIRNNCLVQEGTGNLIYLNYSGTLNIEKSNNNNFFSATPSFYNNTNISGLTNWRSSTLLDSASTLGNPNYKSTSNLHAYSSDLNGRAIVDSRITKDIDGQTRNATKPDIGADEFDLVPVDAGIATIFPFKADSVCVQVVLKNHGNNTLTSATLEWSINGSAKTAYSWSGSLASGDTAIICIGKHKFISNTNYTVKTWTSSPNGVTDTMNFNDTAIKIGKPSLSGIYTIGGTTPDFSTFTAAVAAMNAGGIIDSVLFKVRNGTYSERIVIGAVQGATRKNAIVFESQNKDSSLVILSFATTFTSSFYEVVWLNGANWVSFRHMTIKSTSSSSPNRAVTLSNSASNIEFYHVHFESPVSTSTDYTYSSLVYNDNQGININFTGNRFRNGASAMYMYNNTNVIIRDNFLENAYYFGIYVNLVTKMIFTGNTIKSNSAYSSHYSAYFYQLLGSNTISHNRISGPNKSEVYGLYMQYFYSSNTLDSNYIFNNFIDIGGNNAQYAFYLYNCERTHIANNNFHIHSTRTGTRAVRLPYPYYSRIYNNNFINSDNGPAAQIESPFQTLHDNNNYFTNGSVLAEINGTPYSSLASMKSAGIALNSISANPDFVSNSDLHVQNILLNAAGKPLHFVKRDIDGEKRDSVKPDIGADEFVPAKRDAGVTAFISPGKTIKADSTQIKVAVINRGTDTMTSVRVHCKINADTFAIVTVNDTLASGDTVHVIMGIYVFKRDSINNLAAWTSLPNNGTDQKKSNDTFRIKNKRTSMSGVYTIGGTTPDFTTFKAAIKAMNEAGISGNVRFRVRSGTYTEQLRINPIEGASTPGAIIFESANLDSASVTLRFNSTFSDSNYVIFFNGASFITFRHMTINPLGTSYGTAVLYENGASYNILNNNQIKSSTLNSTGTNYALIASYNSASSEGFNEFNNNLFEGGSYGMYWYGYGPPNYMEDGLKISHNFFKNQFYTGIYIYYQRKALVDRNTFSSTSTYSDYFGIRGQQIYGKTQIIGNHIKRKDYGRYGMYMSGGSGNADTILIANNMVDIGGTSSVYGILVSSFTQCHIVNNTIRTGLSTTSGGSALYVESGGSNQVLNNIVENLGGGNAYYVNSSSIITKSDKNNFRSASTILAYWNGTNYTTLAALKAASGKDASSLSVDPKFLAADNLHVKQIDLNARAFKYPGVKVDIDGEARDTLPDIGADEFQPPALDAGISDIIVPKTPFLPDTQYVKVVLKNFGLNTISSVKIDWEFNSTAQTAVNWTGSLPSNDTVHVILGQKVFNPDSAYSIKVWSSLPNSYNDTVNSNDTAQALQQYPALSGTYTIGGASPDYNTFTDAIEAMKRGGIVGNVLFNVRNGTYTEQLEIPVILGANERHDIVFQSENLDSTLVILTYGANSTYNYTVRLNGARYVTFRHMTISATDYTYGNVFSLVNGASFNSFSNNIIEGLSTTYTGEHMALVYSYVTDNKNNDFNHFMRNVFLNGSMGIYAYGYNNGVYDRNWVIKDNKIESPYYMGIQIYYNDTTVITGNKITNIGYQYGFGMYLYVLRGAFNVSGNYIHIPDGYMGIYFQSCQSFSAKRALVSNNMVTLLGLYDAYGMYTSSCSYINFYNNNIHLASTYTSSYVIQHSSGSNLQSLNNIFEHSGSGYAFYTSSTSAVTVSDYNCYKTNGSNLAYWGGDRANLSALKAANSKDANSISAEPFYISSTDLHVRSIDLSKTGKPLTEVPRDFDGNTRDAVTPDIGADEFEVPSPDDAGIISFAGPFAPFASGSRQVKVMLYNHGSDTLKSATIHWTMNGVAQTPYSWTGSVKSGASDTAKLGNFTFAAGVNYTLRAWPVSPNGVPDTLYYNDTLTRKNIYSGLKGVYTIGGSLPNFITFDDARNALMLGGVLDTVKFKVRNGTYDEQVQLLPYPGSAANKPVTFTSESGDSTKVILQFTSGSNNNYVFSLKGADYVTISNMTLRANDYYYANVVVIDNGAINTTIKNNRLLVTNSSYYYGTGVLSSSDRDDNTKILNNYISGGYYGIQLYGGGSSSHETGLVIDGNVIENSYSSGIFLVYMNAPSIRRNQVSLTSSTGNYIIYLSDISNDLVVSHNKLIGNYTYTYGIYIYNHQGISAKKGLIYNNFISLPDPYYPGIYLSNSNFTNIYYNSINLYGTAYSSSSACVNLQSANNVDMRNNILSNKAGTYAIYCNNTPTVSNYNDLYTTGTNIGHVGSNDYTTLSSWKSGTSRDANSVSVNPNFVTDIDLHTTLINLDSAATPISGITDDIDKNTRNTTRPDIGADEFNSLPNNLAITAIVNPVNGCEIDSQVLSVTVFNYGSNSQKNFPVRFRVNGGSIISQTFTDSVSPGFSKTFTFTGKVNTKPTGNYNFMVWTDLTGEQYRLNDTIKRQVINYQTPDSVGIMIPADSTKNIDYPFSLSWAPSAGATLYDLYIWPDSVSTRPSTPAFSGLTQISKQINGGLGYGIKWKWQIIARNPSCSTPGPLQRFTIRHLPDLIVNSVTTPTSAFSGNDISVSWVVKNIGVGGTGSQNWYDLLYLSSDKLWDGSDIQVSGVINPGSLNSNQSYNRSASVTLPNGLIGKYYIIVRSDAYGYLLESNEGNNIKSDSAGINVSLTPPPDLRVTSIIKPGTAFSGQTINVRYTVKNFGTGGTRTTNWYDYVYLNSDSIPGGTLMKNIYRNGALDPDSQYVVNTSFTLPLTISGGYYVNVKTDATNAVYEHASETNNSRISDSMKVILTPPPDLIVKNIVFKDTVANSETVNVKYSLINQGGSPTTHSWLDNFYISKFQTFSTSNAISVGAFWRSNIQEDDTAVINQSIVIPPDINGPYYLFIFTDVYNYQFEGGNDTNNVTAAHAVRVESPDLVIPSVVVPAADTSGREILVQWFVKNTGEGRHVNMYREDEIFISRHSVFHPDSVTHIKNVGYNISLNPGDSIFRSTLARIPNGIYGTKYIYVKTDVLGHVFENLRENNNTRRSNSINVALAPYPDLRTILVTAPDTSEAGLGAVISYKVENKGNRSAMPIWKDRVYVSKDSIYNPAKLILLKTNSIVSALLKDSSYAITETLTLPFNLSAGNYYFYVESDYTDVLYEYLFEANNIKRSKKVYIKGYPPVDLTVTATTIPSGVYSGTNVNFSWKVKNIGDVKTAAADWTDRIYISTDSILGPTDRVIEDRLVQLVLEKDSSYTRNVSVTIPNGLSGDYYVFFKTDFRDNNKDNDTLNNIAIARASNGTAKVMNIILSLSSDLQISFWNVPSTGIAGQPVKIIWKVENKGDTTTKAGHWIDGLYLSTDYILDGSDMGIGSKTKAGNVLKNGFYIDTADFFLPNVTGNYIVLIKTDDANREYEHNAENNNMVASVITISQAPPGDLVVSSVIAPSNVKAGSNVNVSYQIKNRGSNPINGSRTDNIYISTDTIFDSDDILFASVSDYASMVPNTTRNLAASGSMSGIKTGTYYFIVFTDVRENINETRDTNNTGYSNGIDVSIPLLPHAVLTPDTLFNNKNLYYRLEIPDSLAGESFLITLKGDSLNGHNEFYARHGDVPERSEFDYAFSIPFFGNQEILIPKVLPGTYYLLVYGSTSAGTRQNVTLYAKKLEFEIRKVTPVVGGNTGRVTLKIEGSKFDSLTVFSLSRPGIVISMLPLQVPDSGLLVSFGETQTPLSMVVVNPTLAYVTFDLQGQALGLYDVVATKDAENAKLKGGFTIIPGSPPNIEVSILSPSSTRSNAIISFSIQFKNSGNTDMVNGFLEVVSNGGAPISLTPGGLSANKTVIQIPLEEFNGIPGILRPGGVGTINIYTSAISTLAFNVIIPN